MWMLLYLWVAAMFVLLGYHLFVVFPFAFGRKAKLPKTTDFLPDLSVIICAKNDLQNLKDNLPHILNQHYAGKVEVLVVNDASTDGSAVWLDAFQQEHPHLRVLHLREGEKRGSGKKGALALGIEAASFEHLVLTDADCRPASRNWLSSVAKRFSHSDLILGYGPVHPRNIAESRGVFLDHFCRWEAFNTALTYFSFAFVGYPYMGVGRNLAYTKTLYKKVGGFDAHMHLASGDDDLFVKAAETKSKPALMLEGESRMYSAPPASWSAWLAQRSRHLSTSYEYTPFVKWSLSLIGLANLLFYPGLLLLLMDLPAWIIIVLLCKVIIQNLGYYKVAGVLGEDKLWRSGFFMEFLSTAFTAYFHLYRLVKPKKKIVWS